MNDKRIILTIDPGSTSAKRDKESTTGVFLGEY